MALMDRQDRHPTARRRRRRPLRAGAVLGRGGMADVYRAATARSTATWRSRSCATTPTTRPTAPASRRGTHPRRAHPPRAGDGPRRRHLRRAALPGDGAGRRAHPRRAAARRAGSRRAGPRDRPPVADALAYAHGRGVVHRDVKPGNVLLGAGERVKLADFGIARLIGDTVRTPAPAHAIGTAAYLSPEQVTGDAVSRPPTSTRSACCCSSR